MKRRSIWGKTRFLAGYTIVEVMIFLAVSGGLLISASALISGRQERTRFTQSVVALEQELQDTFNDVSTGYFPSGEDFTCSVVGVAAAAMIDFEPAASEQGSNSGCIFLGKLIELPVGTSKYNSYSMVGLQQAVSLTSHEVKLLGAGSNPGIFEKGEIEADVQVTKLVDTFNVTYRALAIVPEFSETGPSNSVTGNAARVQLFGYKETSFSDSALNGSNFTKIDSALIICLQQGGGGRRGALTITKQLTIDREIDSQPAGVC